MRAGDAVELRIDCLNLLGRVDDKKIDASDWSGGASGNDVVYTSMANVECGDTG
jgi:hypothetical protein